MSSTKDKPEPLITWAVQEQRKRSLIASFKRIGKTLKKDYDDVYLGKLVAETLIELKK